MAWFCAKIGSLQTYGIRRRLGCHGDEGWRGGLAWPTKLTGRNGHFGVKKVAIIFTQYTPITNYYISILVKS